MKSHKRKHFSDSQPAESFFAKRATTQSSSSTVDVDASLPTGDVIQRQVEPSEEATQEESPRQYSPEEVRQVEQAHHLTRRDVYVIVQDEYGRPLQEPGPGITLDISGGSYRGHFVFHGGIHYFTDSPLPQFGIISMEIRNDVTESRGEHGTTTIRNRLIATGATHFSLPTVGPLRILATIRPAPNGQPPAPVNIAVLPNS